MTTAHTPLSDPAHGQDAHQGLDLGHAHAHDASEQRVDLKILACFFGAMLLIAAVIARFVFDTPQHGAVLGAIASVLLGVPIVFEALRGLVAPQRGHSHMDELIAVAVVAAFASGQYIECGFVAFFMLISSFVEHRTAVGALKTIESLIRITPTRARRLGEGGEEHEVEATALRPGDVVVVRPGDYIPADGTIRAGQSTINQANVTGESLPVEKADGDEVFSGTINETGRLEVEVTRAGEDSTLGQVQKLILQAAESKPAVARLLEKYAAYYTPVVLIIGFIVFFFTHSVDRMIALWLIACPFALILAGPTAIVAALSAAARLGVYIKSVTDLEVARRVTAIVFDKTGTLTEGVLSVTRMKPIEGVEGAELLRLCAAAEQDSKHPTARAVMRVARKARVQLPAPQRFEEVAGKGVIAEIEGRRVVVGRESFLRDQGIDAGALDAAGVEGLSLLLVARDGEAIGWLGLADTVRGQAGDAMRALEDLGVQRRVMITGDRWSPARRVAQQVGITDIEAEALPGDKLELVENLKAHGHTVGVIGDGVNDGPALAAGHISIAMGAAGSDVAIHSASIALMNNNLDRIPFLVHLSKRTLRVIRQNLVGTLLYVFVMLVLLSVGLITPMIAAVAHGISSIAVVFNSARLIREGEHLQEHAQAAPPPGEAAPPAPAGQPASA